MSDPQVLEWSGQRIKALELELEACKAKATLYQDLLADHRGKLHNVRTSLLHMWMFLNAKHPDVLKKFYELYPNDKECS